MSYKQYSQIFCKRPFVLIAAITSLFQMFTCNTVQAGLFGPDNFEECVAKEAKKGLSKAALYWVAEDCRKKFPRKYRYLSQKELRKMVLTDWSFVRREKGKRYDWPGNKIYTASRDDLYIQGKLTNPTKDVYISAVRLECKIENGKKFEIGEQTRGFLPGTKALLFWSAGVPSSFPTMLSLSWCKVIAAYGEERT